MAELTQYYQGDTILFNIEWKGVGQIGSEDFVSLIYTTIDSPCVIRKDEMQESIPGVFTGRIPSRETAVMPEGVYTHEVLLRQENGKLNSIAMAPAFKLSKSAGRSEILKNNDAYASHDNLF